MPTAKIEGHGVTVELDATETSIEALGELARKLHQQVSDGRSEQPGSGFGFGFGSERRASATHHHEKYHGDFGTVQT